MLPKRSDAELVDAILRELRGDSHVATANLSVEVNQGVATLNGTVSSYAKKIFAQEAAHRVRGVRDVANDIEVRSAELSYRSDTEIAAAVREAIERDALIPNERITSTVSEGWVTLEGDVDFWRQRQDAQNAILRLAGVVGVNNKITIRQTSIDPEQLRAQIELALKRRAYREAERLRLDIHDGAVDLWGRVHSLEEKRAVLGSIEHARGVRRVRDHLRIDPYF